MKEVLFYILAFVTVYLFYFLLVYMRKKQLKKYRTGTEVKLLQNLSNADLSKIKSKTLVQIMAFANALIITLTLFIVSFIQSFPLKLLAGFVVLMVLIIVVYKLLGILLEKKYGTRKKES